MKKIISLLMMFCVVLMLAACSGGGSGNSVKSVTSADDFAEIGIKDMKMPDLAGFNDISYAIVDGEMAQINFTYNGYDFVFCGSKDYTYRKMFGINDDPMHTNDYNVSSQNFTIYDVAEGMVGQWQINGVNYACYGKHLTYDDAYSFGRMLAALAGLDVTDDDTVELPVVDEKTTKDSIDLWFRNNNFIDVDYEYQNSDTVPNGNVIALSRSGKAHPYDEITVYVSSGSAAPKTVTITDDSSNISEADFIQKMNDLGLVPSKTSPSYFSTTISAGNVWGFDDGTYPVGSTIRYRLSRGPYQFDADEYNGLSESDAQALADKYKNMNGHVSITFKHKENGNREAGKAYDCECTMDGVNANVFCKIAETPTDHRVDLPNYVGTSSNPCGDQNSCSLNSINYTINRVEDDNSEGYVSAQSVPAGKVDPGTNVTLTVSKKKPALYNYQSGYYQDYEGVSYNDTVNELAGSCLKNFSDVEYVGNANFDYRDGQIMNVYIYDESTGNWNDNFLSDRYKSTTSIRVDIANNIVGPVTGN